MQSFLAQYKAQEAEAAAALHHPTKRRYALAWVVMW